MVASKAINKTAAGLGRIAMPVTSSVSTRRLKPMIAR
jgi:hypothetical protein